MKNTPFFLTSHQHNDTGVRIPEDTLQAVIGSEPREAKKTSDGCLSFHNTKILSALPKRVKFSKSVFRRQNGLFYPHQTQKTLFLYH